MKSTMKFLAATALLALSGIAAAQMPSDAEEEKLDMTLRKFGYVSGQAFQCHSKEQQLKLEKTALNVGTNILRLFGSDRAFFFAAAFGAGAAEQLDTKTCPDLIRQAEVDRDDLRRELIADGGGAETGLEEDQAEGQQGRVEDAALAAVGAPGPDQRPQEGGKNGEEQIDEQQGKAVGEQCLVQGAIHGVRQPPRLSVLPFSRPAVISVQIS